MSLGIKQRFTSIFARLIDKFHKANRKSQILASGDEFQAPLFQGGANLKSQILASGGPMADD
ncbi:hypothetical protein ACE1CD_16420 [Aerosakkonema sp. BLCC-F183]|uniref:hypothetical protein n=1 Tax=Aerosakkonema sp. BLCC-F183 TaxID=3342834 RepID=UPI0035B7EA7F